MTFLLRILSIATIFNCLVFVTCAAEEMRITDSRGLTRFSGEVGKSTNLRVKVSKAAEKVWLMSDDGLQDPFQSQKVSPEVFEFRSVKAGRFTISVVPESVIIKSVSIFGKNSDLNN